MNMVDGARAAALPREPPSRKPVSRWPNGHERARVRARSDTLENLLDKVRDASVFTTLAVGIVRAGLEETLAGDHVFTVFAPVDDAFAEFPDETVESMLADREALTTILSYHVVPGRITALEAAERQRLPTVQGEELWVSGNDPLRVDGARVLSADVAASNGLIHAIDRVLLPARI
jgi:uncharacterized surface protein with fasciclin (FAS1) repeats